MLIEDVIDAIADGQPIDAGTRQAVIDALVSSKQLRAALLVDYYLDLGRPITKVSTAQNDGAFVMAAIVLNRSPGAMESAWRKYRDALSQNNQTDDLDGVSHDDGYTHQREE